MTEFETLNFIAALKLRRGSHCAVGASRTYLLCLGTPWPRRRRVAHPIRSIPEFLRDILDVVTFLAPRKRRQPVSAVWGASPGPTVLSDNLKQRATPWQE